MNGRDVLKSLMGVGALGATLASGAAAHAQATATDFACANGATYERFIYDRKPGAQLHLNTDGTGSLGVWENRSHPFDTFYNLRWSAPHQAQDNVSGRTGPGYIGTATGSNHRIVIFVDFANTPTNTADDRRFDGYLYSSNTGIAGVTWKNNVPFGFAAMDKLCW